MINKNNIWQAKITDTRRVFSSRVRLEYDVESQRHEQLHVDLGLLLQILSRP